MTDHPMLRRWIPRLARDHPQLLEAAIAGEISTTRAAEMAGMKVTGEPKAMQGFAILHDGTIQKIGAS